MFFFFGHVFMAKKLRNPTRLVKPDGNWRGKSQVFRHVGGAFRTFLGIAFLGFLAQKERLFWQSEHKGKSAIPTQYLQKLRETALPMKRL